MIDKEYNVLDIYHIKEILSAECIIYGAGMYGNNLYSFLKIKGLENRVISFAVSNKEGNPDVIDDIPVRSVKELKDEMENCTVVLAIGTAHIDEVISRLQKYTTKKIYLVTKEIMGVISQEIFNEMEKFPLEKNKIFISCYEGMGYRCNCKYIAERLIQDHYPVKIVWGVIDKNIQDIPEEIQKVKMFTYEYYKELYTSRVCITNNQLVCQKKKGQYYINTWHGFGPFKKVQGSLSINRKKLDEIKETNANYDLFLTGSTFYSQVYRDSFFYEGEIYECGAPRNDIFFENTGIRDSVYRQFKIPFHKKIVLYAPTFRTDIENSFNKYDLDMPDILNILSARFGGEYVLMYRFHHHLYNMEECLSRYKDGINATYYPDIQELLVAADVVITDYSSLMWDFSIQRKPVFLYQNDEEDYIDDRGFYCPVSQWPYPRAHSKEELVDRIREFNNEEYINNLNTFLKKYGSCDDGKASGRVAEKIMEVINRKS